MTRSTTHSAEEAITSAVNGRLSKLELATMLTFEARRRFLTACADVELRYTDDCHATNDPCLASWCSADGERCLELLLRPGAESLKACGAEWAKLFTDRRNRKFLVASDALGVRGAMT